MIDGLTGKLVLITNENYVCVQTAMGIHFSARIPKRDLHTFADALENQTEVTVITRLVWSETNGPMLFGFSSYTQRRFFDLLTEIPGIGSNKAMMMLDVLSPDQLFEAASVNDTKAISKVPGIGPRLASAVIAKARTIGGITAGIDESVQAFKPLGAVEMEALRMMVALGYSASESRGAIAEVKDSSTAASLFRDAISVLRRR